MSRCPICDRPAKPREPARRARGDEKGNEAFPFCSPRCKTIDLGKWLNEEYRVPVTEADDDPDDDGTKDMRH